MAKHKNKVKQRGRAALSLASKILSEVAIKERRRVWRGKEHRQEPYYPTERVLFDRRGKPENVRSEVTPCD